MLLLALAWQAWERITGHSAGDVLGKPCKMLKVRACRSGRGDSAGGGGRGYRGVCCLFVCGGGA